MSPYFEAEEEVSPKLVNSIWVENYRPSSLDDFIGSDSVKSAMRGFIEKNDVPHVIFFGPPGTGKTTLGRMLINSIPCDSIEINASDENGVDNIRNKVQDFAMTMGIHPLKIIFLDEADRLTPDAQCILRNLMETYSLHTRFILTCNYKERIIPALHSRCQCFEIKPPSKKDCAGKLASILTSENIKFQLQDVVFIVHSYFPDMRKIINFAQQSTVAGEIRIAKENAIDSDYKTKLVELLKSPNRNFTTIRQLIADAAFSNYEEVYKHLYDQVGEYAPGQEALVIVQLAESSYQSALVFEREITFCAAMHKILKILK